MINGIAASYGIAIGPAWVYRPIVIKIQQEKNTDVKAEIKRLHEALSEAKQQLGDLYKHTSDQVGEEEAEIFTAHQMFLEDPELISAVEESIINEQFSASMAVDRGIEAYAQALDQLEDEYFKARAQDVRDVGRRVLYCLMGVDQSKLATSPNEPSIIVANDLMPSDTVNFKREMVLGFCTAEGGATSHTAILARSLGLPAVVGAGIDIQKFNDGELVILDGDSGKLIIEPDKNIQREYETRQNRFLQVKKKADALSHEPAVTIDGHKVEIAANIGNVIGAETALDSGAEGVGLLRSEFLYLERKNLPSEEEQYQIYKTIADMFGKLPVILRTLDVGGDKDIPYIDIPIENNPFLGLRAIRLCLTRPELFKTQLRAALRAGVGNNLKLMFPMVATIQEVKDVKAMLDECKRELVNEGYEVADQMEVGIMIEIPAAAIMADKFAQEVDFFSIGTNDLSQYTLAADRTNSKVAQIASGFQPAVFRLIKQVIDAAHKEGKWVGLCGEMAGELLAIPILLGLGLDEFSMNPPAVPYAKQLIRSLSMKKARLVAEEALDKTSCEEIEELLKVMIPEVNLE